MLVKKVATSEYALQLDDASAMVVFFCGNYCWVCFSSRMMHVVVVTVENVQAEHLLNNPLL
jgi:hypothetical protein